MRRRFYFLAPLLLLGFLGFVAFGVFIVQQLWNWLLPALFGWPALTFWQALGLLALCRILFGGVSMRGGGPRRHRGRGRCHPMSSEERERFRSRIRQRLGVDDPPAAGSAAR
jgi:hypothetical protein